jgi:hypothetical protein
MAEPSPYPSEERMWEVFNLLAARIERRYGIPVRIDDVTDPFTGDLDGAEIRIDYANDVEGALFILVHLFGHTVQWNTDPRAQEIGTTAQNAPDEAHLGELQRYETDACRYSLQLLHEAGIADFDQWLSDFSHCDFAYLSHFYRTGSKAPFRGFWKTGSPPLAPLPIPEFTPTRWKMRWGGVVV